MNNKIKKLFAGIGLGMAGICLLTGCSANIDVSQDDVDKTLSNANAYFTSVDDTKQNLQNIDTAIQDTNESLTDINDNLQNINNNLELQTKNSESARQYLLSLLSNGMYDSIGKQEFSMTMTSQQYEFDVLETSTTGSFKAYWEGNTYKALVENSAGNIIYREVTRNVDDDTKAVTYTENLYLNDIGDNTKTYTIKENLEYIDYMSMVSIEHYHQLYLYAYSLVNKMEDAVYSVETIDGGLRFAMTYVDSETLNPSTWISDFVDGKLTKITVTGYGKVSNALGGGLAHYDGYPYYVMTLEFNDTVTPIEFDKTGYVLDTNE